MNIWFTTLWMLLVASDLRAEVGLLAGSRSDIPSCRQYFFHQQPGAALRELVIAVDRTVTLDESLRRDTIDRVTRAIRSGDHLAVVTFSGLTKAEFTAVQFEGDLELPATEAELENQIPASKIRAASKCFQDQLEFGRRKVHDSLTSLLKAPISDAQRSEILRALTTISQEMIASSTAPQKRVVVVSDMLEFSDVASFYANRSMRAIDPVKTLEVAKAAQLVGTFNGARVFIAGAAAVSNPGQRGPGLRERQLLKQFWEGWFRASNASVVGLDNPALLQEIE